MMKPFKHMCSSAWLWHVLCRGMATALMVILAQTALHAQSTQMVQPLQNEILGKLSELTLVRSEFIQTRRLSVLKQPVISRGKMLYVAQGSMSNQANPLAHPPAGLVWQLTQPLAVQYVMTTQGFIELDAQGLPRRQAGRIEQAMQEVGKIMAALFAGNPNGLDPYFQLTASGQLRAWQLRLQPKQNALQKMMQSIEVNGREGSIQRVTLLETSGDSLVMEFQAQPHPEPVSAQEKQWLMAPASR